MSKIFTTLIFKNKFCQITFGLSLVINLIIWLSLYYHFFPLQHFGESVPLRFNIYFGINLIGKWYEVFVMPIIGLFFIAINFILADVIYLRDKIVSYFLLGTSVFTQILLGLAAYMIVLINQ
jgi:hypothetical protein